MKKDTIFTVVDRDGDFFCYIIIKSIEPEVEFGRKIQKKYNYALKNGGDDFIDLFEKSIKKMFGFRKLHFVYEDMKYIVGGG